MRSSACLVLLRLPLALPGRQQLLLLLSSCSQAAHLLPAQQLALHACQAGLQLCPAANKWTLVSGSLAALSKARLLHAGQAEKRYAECASLAASLCCPLLLDLVERGCLLLRGCLQLSCLLCCLPVLLGHSCSLTLRLLLSFLMDLQQHSPSSAGHAKWLKDITSQHRQFMLPGVVSAQKKLEHDGFAFVCTCCSAASQDHQHIDCK